MSSPDSHRWALTVDALERCEAMGGESLHLRLLKIIALVDLLKDRSGLVGSTDLLKQTLPGYGADEITRALAILQDWSLIVFRKFSNAFGIFEGSDFDIDHAVSQSLSVTDEVDFARLNVLADLQPIVAKRHYHDTGALRWFDVSIVALNELAHKAAAYAPQHGAIGAFFLVIATLSETAAATEEQCRRAANLTQDWDIVVGLPRGGWDVTSLFRELLALEHVRREASELQGDRVARREMDARIAALQGQLARELEFAFDNATWYGKGREAKPYARAELNSLASELAGSRFARAPRLHNELLNRIKPSSNAVAAQNALLRRMVLNEGDFRLGIEGFPAEGGLFDSLLAATGLYKRTLTGWRFVAPAPEDEPCCQLTPAWQVATEFLESNAERTVSVAELYDLWRQAPFGIKDGLLPVLAVAFILSKRRVLAFYRQGVFQARVTDLDIDYLAKDPTDIQLRSMNLSEMSRHLLSDLAHVVRELDEENTLTDLEPIDVAKGLVAIYVRLPSWVDRTQRLSANAKRVRQLFKQASDPNKLIFDDIPHQLRNGLGSVDGQSVVEIANRTRDGLMELRGAYPSMLRRLRETLLNELQVPSIAPTMLAELRARAANVRHLSGDFRLEAFVVRLEKFHGTEFDMESLAGMAANKPPRSWVDTDIDRATLELATLAQRFIRAEAFAHVMGRPDKRQAMAVVVGTNGQRGLVHREFDVTELESDASDSLVDQVLEILVRNGEKRSNVILAALAKLSTRFGDTSECDQEPLREGRRAAP